MLPLCFRFSHSKERRWQLPGPERAPKEKRQGRKAGGAGETLGQGSRAVSGAGLGGWGFQVFVSVCALRRAERGVYHSHCWLCFPCSLPSSALPLTKTRCCYLARLSSQFTSRSQWFLLVSLWLQGQTWRQSDPRGSPKEWSWRRLHLLLIL